jgi:hypothetical protein
LEENNDHLSAEARENLLIMLVALSRSDGNLHVRELKYLELAAQQLGFDVVKLEETMTLDITEKALPTEEKDRMTALYYLLFLAVEDDQLNALEEDFIYHFGFKLGFNESMLRDMLALFKKTRYPKNPDELLNIIRKYLN